MIGQGMIGKSRKEAVNLLWVLGEILEFSVLVSS